jgi:hypothetical protein
VYLADNPNGNNLGNDQGDLNVPQAYAQIINSTITFNVSIRYLTNYYVYLTYNQISDYPYGSRPVNFIVNPTDPISVRNITGVTGNINISSVIVNRSTNFIITLGNWLASYTTYGINKLYAYYKDIECEFDELNIHIDTSGFILFQRLPLKKCHSKKNKKNANSSWPSKLLIILNRKNNKQTTPTKGDIFFKK